MDPEASSSLARNLTAGEELAPPEVVAGGSIVDGSEPWTVRTGLEESPAHGARSQRVLWNAFWTRHTSNTTVFDALLWVMRNLLARRHAKGLVRYCRETGAQGNPVFRMLEIGCGSATTSRYVGREGPHIQNYAVDLSRQAVEVARKRNPAVRCAVADAVALPLAEGMFSLTFSGGVIEHFDRSVAHDMLEEHCRVTSPRGTVAVFVPWKHSLYNLLRILCGRFWPFGYEDPFSRTELRTFAQSHRLKDVKVRACYGITLLATGIRSPSVVRQAESSGDPLP